MSTFPTLLHYVAAFRHYVWNLANENLISKDRASATCEHITVAYRDCDVDALRDLADEMRFFDIDESCIAFFE